MFSTDSDARQAFIHSLRALADYLACEPGIPVPAVRDDDPPAP